MKKILSLLLATVMMSTFLSACSSNQELREVDTSMSSEKTKHVTDVTKPSDTKDKNEKKVYVTLFSKDGESRSFPEDEVEDAIKDGWYEEPVTIMYNIKGESVVVTDSELEKYRDAGWMTEDERKIFSDYKRILTNTTDWIAPTDNPMFDLVYIDNDAIPELVYRTNSAHVSGVSIFTMSDGTVKQLTTTDSNGYVYDMFGSWGNMRYREKGNIIISSSMNQGNVTIFIYELKNGSLTQIYSMLDTTAAIPDEGGYFINNTEVSEEEFNQKCDEYNLYDDNYYLDAISETSYELTSDNIEKILG